jgi:hypothetical protein
MSRIRALPSPALVVALIALVAAVSGAAVAKGGKTVTKKQAKNIANNQIAAKAPGLSVSHATTAGSADSAEVVDGQRVIKVFAKIPSSTPSFATISNLGGGFELQAACPSVTGAQIRLAFTRSVGVDLKAGLISDSGSSLQADDTAGPTTIDLSDNILGETSFSAASTDGTVVSGTIGFDTPGSFNGELVCAFYGHVTEG